MQRRSCTERRSSRSPLPQSQYKPKDIVRVICSDWDRIGLSTSDDSLYPHTGNPDLVTNAGSIRSARSDRSNNVLLDPSSSDVERCQRDREDL